MSTFESSEDEVRELQPRFRLVYGVVLVTFLIIFARLWFLQIMQGDELRAYSEKNRVKETKIRAPRGLILDREDRILVDNITGFDATISPQYAEDLEVTAQVMGPILDIEPEKIVTLVNQSKRKNGPYTRVTIKENLTYEEAFRLRRIIIDHPEMNVVETVLRFYPLDQNGAQLFGYVGEVSKKQMANYNEKYFGKVVLQQGDIVGQSGLEEVWDLPLRGRDGLSFIEVDAHGRESPTENKAFLKLDPLKAVPGYSLELTIDKDIQEAALKAMLEQKDKVGPRIGALVAMKTNGEILAWVNLPSFNPNRFARGISKDLWQELINDPFKPLRNKIIQDPYPPGSTLKPIIGLAALQEGVITENTIVSAPGQMKFGNRTYHDSLRQGHGNINVLRAVESSSNIFFYKMGIQLGIDNMAKYAKLLGLGALTKINLSNESPGEFPTRESKLAKYGEAWQPGENLSNAIGQGFVLTSLLQMTLAYNVIATDGKLYQPMLVKRIIDENNKLVQQIDPKVVRDVTENAPDGTHIDKKHIKTIREAMRRVANGEHGTARWWKIPGVEMAGKTGTSQVMSISADDIYQKCENQPFNRRHHGSFVAFAPFNNPEIVVGVFAMHSCHGNVGAAPIVRDVIRTYIEKYHPDLIKDKAKARIESQPIVEEEITE